MLLVSLFEGSLLGWGRSCPPSRVSVSVSVSGCDRTPIQIDIHLFGIGIRIIDNLLDDPIVVQVITVILVDFPPVPTQLTGLVNSQRIVSVGC